MSNNNIFNREEKDVLAILSLIKIGLLIVLAIIFLFKGFYTLGEESQAVVTTFGVPKTVHETGLHFKIPFIQKVQKVRTTINGFSIGYNQDTGETIENESLMITKDFNFVNVDFFVEYQVTDPTKALYNSENPVLILKTIASSYIREAIGTSSVDDVITTGKNEIQAKIKEKIMNRLIEEDLGIQLINITIQDAEPPTLEVIQAFKNVETAKQGKETAINNANKYKSEQVPAAEAKVDEVLKKAETIKMARINEAEGDVARFNSMYDEYKKYPLITKQRMFYETMEDILPNLKVIIDGGEYSNIQKLLPLDSLISIDNSTNSTKEDK